MIVDDPLYIISDSSNLQRFDVTTGKSQLLQKISSGMVSSVDFDVTSSQVFFGNNVTNTLSRTGKVSEVIIFPGLGSGGSGVPPARACLSPHLLADPNIALLHEISTTNHPVLHKHGQISY